jgi:hypothetical protein
MLKTICKVITCICLISIVVCSICINAAELNSLDAWAKEVKKN